MKQENKIDNSALINAINRLRGEGKLSGDGVAELSSLLNYNKGDISSFLSNKKRATAPFLGKFALHFNIDLDDLITKEPRDAKRPEPPTTPSNEIQALLDERAERINDLKYTIQLQKDKIKSLESELQVCVENSRKHSTPLRQ